MPRVMDLPGWPPQPGGATTKGNIFPSTADQVIIERVITNKGDYVLFACKFNGESVLYHFPLLDIKIALKIEKILSNNVGKTLLSIGFIEIPSDES